MGQEWFKNQTNVIGNLQENRKETNEPTLVTMLFGAHHNRRKILLTQPTSIVYFQ